MVKKSKLTPIDKSRLQSFNNAFRTLEKFGFTAAEAGELIGIKTRTMFRMLAGERPIGIEELLALQTALVTALALQNKALHGLDIGKVIV